MNDIRILLHELKEIDEGISQEAEWKENLERSELLATNTRHDIANIYSKCREHKDKMMKEQNKSATCNVDMDILCKVRRYNYQVADDCFKI